MTPAWFFDAYSINITLLQSNVTNVTLRYFCHNLLKFTVDRYRMFT
jgi:hypothetical protein